MYQDHIHAMFFLIFDSASFGSHYDTALVFTININNVKLNFMELPQKKYYRQRAHSNPLADHTVD